MERYKTLNNRIARDIIRYACIGSYRAVYMLLYNYRDAFEDDVHHRLCEIISELSPLNYEIYSSLPNIVQNYYNQLWLNDSHYRKYV